MGRRPNRLILEFFERGPKLPDASNRYQHTCKACGEKFPKGRIDSLTNHLVKKCQAIPMADRQRALLQLHELPTTIDPGTTSMALSDAVMTKDNTKNLPFGATKSPWGSGAGFIGLEALAEASRQVNASSEQKTHQTQNFIPGTASNERNDVLVDPSLENLNYPFGQNSTESDGQFMTATSLPSMHLFQQTMHNSRSTSPRLPDMSLARSRTPSARQSSHLSMIAASASEMMPPAAFPIEPGIAISSTDFNPRLFDGQTSPAPKPSATWPIASGSPDNMFLYQTPEEQQQQTANAMLAVQRAQTYPRPIAPNSDSTASRSFHDLSNLRVSKPKARGRFDPIRRREVQEVRKQGACMRCRMLKKPCSGETPCSTCRNVESPRMWKHACIRTKLVEEFELWAVGLHTTLAWVDVNRVKSELDFLPYLGRVEVSHFEESGFFLGLAAIQAGRSFLNGRKFPRDLDPALAGNLEALLSQVTLIGGDNDDLSVKLGIYMKNLASNFYEKEKSPFLGATLLQLAQVVHNNQENPPKDPREDILLRDVLELWIATYILVDGEMGWTIQARPFRLPSETPVVNLDSLATEEPIPFPTTVVVFNEQQNSESYFLMRSQLQAAVEKRASVLSKEVVASLERRLLQRQQSDWFETFLAALILLNCVERITWLFMTWGVGKQDPSRWPLDRPPSEYSGQGERLSEILHMLLKMRGLPAKTAVQPDTGTLALVENKHQVANQWYETVKLTVPYLESRSAADFDPLDCRSLDLKYAAKLLFPTASFS